MSPLFVQMAKTLSTIITNRVKTLKFDRYERRPSTANAPALQRLTLSRPETPLLLSYKIVTLVTVGEAADQGVQVVGVSPPRCPPSLAWSASSCCPLFFMRPTHLPASAPFSSAAQGSRCLFDQEKDSFASGSYRNASLFAVATVYGVYYE